MKKNLIKIFAIVLVVAMSAVAFAACVPSDPAKAEANLKENGYSTSVVDTSGILGAIGNIAAGLIGNKVPENVSKIVTGIKDTDNVTILYFADKDSAAKYFDAYKSDIKANKDKTKQDAKAKLDAGKITQEDYDAIIDGLNNQKFGKTGSAVYFGTKAGVKAAN